ncbi:F-box/kelch-repeat protein [Iris pallida]|uniref:F-box/kelch-repeat protein n=1 Tax=Iris pallida TaxID=29817 RepID=A0AAX6H5A4_IRIPA|nr:F-box/kelch-repeat protein [Iris pallida]
MQRVRISSQQSPVQRLGHPQMTLSPRFRLASSMTPSSSFRLWSPPPESRGPLIPGLPDDVALNCLLRLPVDTHAACRSVCLRWRLLLSDKEHFFTQRKALGLSDPFLFTFAFHRCTGKIQWLVLDLARHSWHPIPAMPCRGKVCPHGFGCIAFPLDGSLMVCGGLVSDLDCPLHLVLKYSVLKNKWTVTARMHTARSFFASGVIDGRVYVAGGYSADQFELSSAEVFDPVRGDWKPVASMGANMACYDSAVLGRKLYVTEGWMWPFLASPIGQVYDPKNDSWEPMAVGMREGWTGPSVVVGSRLFVVSEREGMRVKVYDADSDCWDIVGGSSVPERIRKPYAVSANGNRIYVVGRGLRVAVGHVQKSEFGDGNGNRNGNGRERFCIQWQEIDAPAPRVYGDLTPSSTRIVFA